jgi:hypothetical protein
MEKNDWIEFGITLGVASVGFFIIREFRKSNP